MKLSEVKGRLRAGEYAWPGGYPMYFVMGDGEAMHFDCVKANWREVVGAHLQKFGDRDWRCEGVEINYEDGDLICCQCNERIESAYAEDLERCDKCGTSAKGSSQC